MIGAGFFLADDLRVVASSYPAVHFALLDATVAGPNVEGVLFKVQESGALVGVIAGMLEATGRAPKHLNTISAIGVKLPDGSVVPDVEHYVAGYRWGAKLVDPSVKVLIDYAHQFFGDECGTIAAAQFQAGADIIFPVAGGCSISAYHAAGLAGVYSIGVDISQKSQDPSVIVSAVKRNDWATYDVIKAAVEGQFSAGIVSLGLSDEAAGYTVDNFPDGKLPPDIRRKVADVEQEIEAGSLVPATTL